MATYLFDASALLKRYFAGERGAEVVAGKRPGPFDALLVACALEFDLDDLVLVSSDLDLNDLAESFGIRTLDPENPPSTGIVGD